MNLQESLLLYLREHYPEASARDGTGRISGPNDYSAQWDRCDRGNEVDAAINAFARGWWERGNV